MSTYEHPTIKALCQAIQSIPGRGHAPFETFLFSVLGGLDRVQCVEASQLNMHWEGHAPLTGAPITQAHAAGLKAALEAYIAAVAALPPFTDVLGTVHALMLSRKGGEGLGQYFTPEDLADLQAKVTASLCKRHPPRSRGPLSIHETACGAGSLVLSDLRHLDGQYPVEDVYVNTVDLDPVCCAMTALQLVVQGVVHGRTVGKVRIYCANALFDPKTWPLFYGHDRVGWMERWASKAA